MAINDSKLEMIEKLLEKKIKDKLKRYTRESSAMPFLIRLIQDSSKVASYSFIHSIATTLGMSIYEEVSVILASNDNTICFRNYDIGGNISNHQRIVIKDIIQKLRENTQEPDYEKEMELILAADVMGAKPQKEGKKADFHMVRNDEEYFFEIKTAKPNIDVFTKSKEKLLEWIARRRKRIHAILAIPYNPYHPKPYKRFTEQNLLKLGIDLMVGADYWDFIGGPNTFEPLLEAFDMIGKKYKSIINAKIEAVAKEKMEDF